MEKRNPELGASTLGVLFLLGFALTAVGGATMALVHKDREIADLQRWTDRLETKHREFLSSLLACANGGGFTMDLNAKNRVEVVCHIEEEWSNGKFYEKDAARKPRKK